MRIVKFPWVKHTEGPRHFEIYSVSVSPDGSRLATGGLDGKVKLWSIETLNKFKKLNEINNGNIEFDKSECRPLCSMSRHEGAITCVRFCPNGRFLASGSDDKLILIWEKDEEKTKIMKSHRNNNINNEFNGINGDGDDIDLEHWTVRKRLVAHDNDVQDMAWAPDGSILVTVGLDRSIIVWNGLTFEKIKKFDIHQSHVKGVVFDPAGKYFTTCSDDRTMRIFRFRRGVNVDGNGNDMEFVIENVISKPFKKAPLTTYFRRCSWSPDGLYIAAPNGTNEGINANVVIKRGTWESDLSLIGHRLPSEVCSFSPRLYNVDSNKNSETVLITAGQDKTLAIWSSSCPTPLCVTTEISAKSITDVSWNSNGLNVFLCGLDGVVLSVYFDESELGKVVPIEENGKILIRYGKDTDLFFPESVEQLKLEEIAEKNTNINKQFLLNKTESDRLKNLMNEKDVNPSLNVSQDHSKVMNVLIPRSKKHPNKQMPVPQSKPIEQTIQPVKVNELSAKSQNITITKSGKKRVAPMLISVSSLATSSTVETINKPITKPSTLLTLQSRKRSKLNKIMSVPYPPLPKNGLPTFISSMRTNLENDVSEIESSADSVDYIADNNNNHHQHNNANGSTTTKSRPSSGTFNRRSNNASNGGGNNNKSLDYNRVSRVQYPGWMKDSVVSSRTIFGEKQSNSNILIENKLLKDNGEQIVEVRFEFENHYKYLSRGEVDFDNTWNEFNSISTINTRNINSNLEKWQLFINKKITCLEESSINDLSYWCMSTDTGTLLIYSTTGRQLCGSIELGSNVVKLICNKEYIMCICSNSLIYSWKFQVINGSFLSGKSIIEGISLAPLVNTHLTTIVKTNEIKRKIDVENVIIDSILMKGDGTPLILLINSLDNDTLKDQDGETTEMRNNSVKSIYTYDIMLDCWIEVLNEWYIEKINDERIINDQLKIICGNDRILKILANNLINESNMNTVKKGQNDKNVKKVIIDSWCSLNDTFIKCKNM